MPWSNQSGGGKSGGPNGGPWGGGNNNGGNNGGPWGNGPRPPSGGGGGGNQPPDLEEIIRRGQDKLRSAIPGGGAGGGSNGFLFGVGAVALLALWGMKAVYTVQPDELGVELLFGKPKVELSTPGIHLHLWPLEEVEKVNVREQLVNIGGNQNSQNSLMLSGDQNIVDIEFSIAYQVVSPQDYLFKVTAPGAMMQQVAESAMREVVGRRPAQDIFRDDRDGIAENVRMTIQNAMDEYGTGLTINAVSIEDAAPPREVADAFEEVQRAEQDEDRFIEEANQYSNQKLGQARGEGAQILEDASAYKTRIVQEAEGEAQRFISVYEEYARAPEVTRKRLFLETMESVLRDSNKIIMEQGSDGQGVVPYLPLPEIQKRNPSAGGTN